MINNFSNDPTKIYSITLTDGTVISDLKMNGNNFVSEKPITEDVFENNLTNIIISDGTEEEIHKYMRLIQIVQYKDGLYYFVLIDIPESELRLMTMESQIEYLSMMTGYDI